MVEGCRGRRFGACCRAALGDRRVRQFAGSGRMPQRQGWVESRGAWVRPIGAQHAPSRWRADDERRLSATGVSWGSGGFGDGQERSARCIGWRLRGGLSGAIRGACPRPLARRPGQSCWACRYATLNDACGDGRVVCMRGYGLLPVYGRKHRRQFGTNACGSFENAPGR